MRKTVLKAILYHLLIIIFLICFYLLNLYWNMPHTYFHVLYFLTSSYTTKASSVTNNINNLLRTTFLYCVFFLNRHWFQDTPAEKVQKTAACGPGNITKYLQKQ